MAEKKDVLIIGAGIVGLAVARALQEARPELAIAIAEKEADTAFHASGRNSGVLHGGFYYTADSLKARFTVEGNKALRDYCREKALPINECGKLVLARDDFQLEQLYELERRGQRNGSEIAVVSPEEAERIEPNARVYKSALWSPRTATVDPVEVCRSIKRDLEASGVEFLFNAPYRSRQGGEVIVGERRIAPRKFVNCAGLYADQIAQDFGFSAHYTVIPFKGLYLKYEKNKTDIRTCIYPVPDLRNPFLGVHFTKTVDGSIKIGPTAIPCLWREQYDFSSRCSFNEMVEILGWEAMLFLLNSFNFRDLAFEEMRKYRRGYFIRQAAELVKELDQSGFGHWSKPGIRAQLLDKRSRKLVQDFVVEGDQSSTHVLNAVSPSFTCSIPFGRYVVERSVLPGL